MPKSSKYLVAVCLVILLAGAHADRKIETYRGAVAGEDIHVGSVSNLLGSSRTYSKEDCTAAFLDDEKTTGGATLELLDSFNGRHLQAYLVAHLKTTSGDFSYELKCGEESGAGEIQVSPAKSFVVNPQSNIYLDLTEDQADKDQYVFVHGIEGNNVSLELEEKDPSGFFDFTLGGVRNLKFYEKKDDGSLVEVRVTTFDKVLPIREWNFRDEEVLQESDLVSTLAVIQNDGATVSYYELESSKDLGMVYVHSGNKAMSPGKEYTLDHCFPVIKDGRVTNYYCTFQLVNVKTKGSIVYFDIASSDEKLERKEFDGVKSILAATPVADGRTALLAVDDKGERKILCFDATNGFDRTPENEKTYFSGKTIKINVNDEECTLNLNTLDPTDFRFGEAAVFDCKASKVLATFDLDNSFDSATPEPATVRSYKRIDAGTVPLCASDDEFITLESTNTVLSFEGAINNPGQSIKLPLGIETATVSKVHCRKDSALVLLDSKKKTYLLDINRRSKKDSITRINSLLDVTGRPSTMKSATSQTAILYSFNKKGQVMSLSQYSGFLGLIRVTSKRMPTPGDHSLKFVVTNGVKKQDFTVRTSIQAEEKFSVETGKPLEGLVPGQEYMLRNYLKINGQVGSLSVVTPEKPRNIFWHPDEVVFANSQNGTTKGSKFAIGDYFVNVETKSYVHKDGSQKKLDATILSEGRYLGDLPLPTTVAIIAAREGEEVTVQGLFVGSNGEIQGSKIVKLDQRVDSSFPHQPHLSVADGKPVVVFFKSSDEGEDRGFAVEYKFDKEQSSFQFVNQDNQKEVEWSTSGSIEGYTIKPVKTEQGSKLSSCIQFKLNGGDLPASRLYYICGVTGGSSERADFRNFVRTTDGKIKFDLLNYPSAKAGSQLISWWEVTSNLLSADGKPVSTNDFQYTVKLVRKFDGLKNHIIKKLFNLGQYAVTLSVHEEKNDQGLFETYFGERGNKPYYTRKVNEHGGDIKDYDLHFNVVNGVSKRIYSNYARSFSNVADLLFRDARVRLSKHLATVHVSQPFTLVFNDAYKVQDVAVKLDKEYADDGKTDEDDERTDPEDDPTQPIKNRKSRLWLILGILALILIVGAADLYLRRRSAIAEAESELDHDKPKVVKKKKTGKNEDGELSKSLNEL